MSFLSLLSGLGLLMSFLSGLLDLLGTANSLLLPCVYLLFFLGCLMIAAQQYYGRDYSCEEFRRLCVAPHWVRRLTNLSVAACAIFIALVASRQTNPPVGLALTVFYSYALAMFVALRPGGLIREGQPTPPPPIPPSPLHFRPLIRPLFVLTALVLGLVFAAQLGFVDFLTRVPLMLLNVALWAPASYLANHAARHQPSKNFWSAALHHCPERWKQLLGVQAALSISLELLTGHPGILVLPVLQLTLLVYLSALNGEN